MHGHWSWQTMLVLWIAAMFVLILPFILRGLTRPHCKRCFYPTSRCTCAKTDACDHAEQFPQIWSQDGWIAKCKTCGEIVYLGDD